ncbi:phosphoribosylamine--glycine ligase [Brevibacillus laterosporus]|uniref:Phosphoribosylamine--glycine ligase n=1 Tax=Brevibacillus halotolerans TaxID=1507437 RepID=A0ABT4I2G6_9BACL|nr:MULTISPECIES: phosphoribosylamine--glycine ligase [Brevibacillus]MCR8987512.1 phosphoribosylamine--glycine ligase [Brevibacillus laterosporus]MCZ0833250.1 phosphoribosylamine--glycine ligase [Brevibacillus halotolerans]
MKVLVVGSGGREHTLVWKLAQSPKVEKIFCAPGNGGTAALVQNVPIQVTDYAALAQFAKDEEIDVTIVGPEDPLLGGIVDFFTLRNLPIYGPTAKAAKLEGSKSFAKCLMKKYKIPTAEYESFLDFESAIAYVREKGAPIVIKADGLAQGKGVILAFSLEEAEEAIRQIMQDSKFGQAGSRVVIEEFMRGEELTLLSFIDGETVKPMIPSQDHKTVFDGDKGPNTGGMGAYAPVPQVKNSDLQHIIDTIVQPMASAMVKEGIPFRGVLYTGLMLTEDGPKVVEFNARFGDPETQVILPLLETDLADIVMATINGTLADLDIKWSKQSAVTVVMASPGYPGDYPKGAVISGLDVPVADSPQGDRQEMVFHAGTKQEAGHFVTNGGRVLAVTAIGDSLQLAKEKAYQAVSNISFTGAHYRRDIADKAFKKV